jgi:hypothetical protein
MVDDRAMRRLSASAAVISLLAWSGCGGGSDDPAGTSGDREYQWIDHGFLNEVFQDGGLSPRAAQCAIPRLRQTTSRAEFARAFGSGHAEEKLFPLLAKAAQPCARRYPAPEVDYHVSDRKMHRLMRHPGALSKYLRHRAQTG